MSYPSFLAAPAALVAALAAALPIPAASTEPADAVIAAVAASEPTKLDQVIITGNPLKDKDFAAPVSVLKDEALLLRRAGSLGDTLSGLPGVASTFFGPNAGRPIVRGLDGERVRVLSNFGVSFDASNLSFDHSPAVDPLAVERVEVVRGPAALLYGGTAIGGVVNIIDRRVAREPIQETAALVEMRTGGAERERGTSAALDGGNGTLAIHADGFSRNTGDYAAPPRAGLPGRVVNSASDSHGGALGLSWTGSAGYAGLSFSDHRSRYGTVAEPDVSIDMVQTRAAFESEWRAGLPAFIDSISARAGHTRYRHAELEGDAVGTRFESHGNDARTELRWRSAALWGGTLGGVAGVQLERSSFSALGEEAFVPSTRSRNAALFALEELAIGAWKWSLGARLEHNRVESDGAGNGGNTRFGAASSRSFSPRGVSLGATWKMSPQWTAFAGMARSQRSPAFHELYADGPHVATAAYETGSRTLGPETSTALDAGVRWNLDAAGHDVLKLSAYANRFDEFIALRRTGVQRDALGNRDVHDCGDGLSVESGCAAKIFPEFRYMGVRARLQGFEFEATRRLVEGPQTLDLELNADFTHATDLTHAEPLPRIAPLRLRGALQWSSGPWGARLDIDHAARQSRVPADDVLGETTSNTRANLSLSYRTTTPAGNALFFLRITNLTDRLAYNASSIDTIRNLAPLPGRGFKAGVQLAF